MIRLYIDEDASDKDLVRALRARGVDVLTAVEAGMIDRKDEEHLDYATAQGRVLYSYNVSDFYQWVAALPRALYSQLPECMKNTYRSARKRLWRVRRRIDATTDSPSKVFDALATPIKR